MLENLLCQVRCSRTNFIKIINMQSNILNQALYLSEKIGWSVIPVGVDKKPTIAWKPYQTQKATSEQIKSWFSASGTNLGIVTGKISNLIVVDIDVRNGGSDEAFKDINTIKCKTGGGGWHYYFKYEDGIQNKAGIQQGIDIRGEGGYVVVPPSIHKSGNSYEWINSPENTEVLVLPEFVKEWIKNTKTDEDNNVSKSNSEVLKGVSEGSRNDSAASTIGKWLKRYPEKEWGTEVWQMTILWNSKNNPPLDEDELRNVFDSIIKTEKLHQAEKDEAPNKRTVADKIVDLVLQSNVELYLDQTGEPHITFQEKPVVGFPIKSSAFKRWVSGKYWEQNGRGFSGDSFLQAIGSLEGKTFHEGTTKNLYNRIAKINNTIYYDLGDDSQIAKITKDGWEITNKCAEKFRRFNHQLPQVAPKRGGDLLRVLNYLNLKTETDKLLFITYLLTIFIPDIPRVILINIGDQGAAKSTALRIIRSLVDPSVTELLSPPTDINELAQASNHHYCLYLDNLSYLRDDLSDALCRLATGIGFTKRKLFTNDEDILFTQKTAIGVTGITLVAQKADLLDRCLILSFERIPEEARMDEEDFWKNFNSEKPLILGSIFDKLTELLRMAPEFKLSKKPRMADYAKYAAIGAITIGRTADEFLNAFNENIKRQNQAAVDSSPTAQSILQFMKDKDSWNGSSSELHKELQSIVEASNLQIGGAEGFPKSSNWLWKRIMQIRPNLSSLGIGAIKLETANGSEISLNKGLREDKNTAITTDTATESKDMAVVATKKETLEESLKNNSIPGLEYFI